MNNLKGGLFVVSGPSGVGKGTICAKLCTENPNIFLSVSATSRAPRTGEIEGVHYYFKTREEFDKMIENDELLEYAHYVNNTYGTPKATCLKQMEKGNNVILEIDVQGGLKVKEKFPETVLIFVVPPNMEELTSRLSTRGTESEEAIKLRLLRAENEFKLIDKYDYIVINDTVENATETLKSIIVAEQYKKHNILNIIKKELGL